MYLKYSGAFVNVLEHLETLGSKGPYGIMKAWNHLGAFGYIRWYLNVLWGVFGNESHMVSYRHGDFCEQLGFGSIWMHFVSCILEYV